MLRSMSHPGRLISTAILLFALMPALSGSSAMAQATPPPAFTIAAGDVPALIKAINTANTDGAAQHMITLAQGAEYDLTAVDHSPTVLNGKATTIPFIGASGLPVISSSITITGNGATIKRTGTTPFRLFTVYVGGNLELDDLTLTGGLLKNGSGNGGAISVTQGSLTIKHCIFTSNHAESGGAIDGLGNVTIDQSQFQNNAALAGGAISNESGFLTGMTITSSTFSGNSAGNPGLSPVPYHGGQGGAIYDSGSLHLSSSQITNNIAEEGGGIYINDSASAQIDQNTRISSNRSTANASYADIPFGGGGISLYRGQLTMDSTIIDHNITAFSGGGLFNREGIFTITNSLITENTAVLGGGVISVNETATDGTDAREGKIHVNQSCFIKNADLQGKQIAGLDGLNNNPKAPVIDAINNWWGDASGPGGEVKGKGDGIYGKVTVTYQPFLTAAPTICAAPLPTPVGTMQAQPTIAPTSANAQARCASTDPRYTITIPAGELASANLTCSLAADGSTYTFSAFSSQTGLPTNIPVLITICFTGKLTITFLSLTTPSANGLPAPIQSFVQNGSTCVKLRDSGVLFLNPPLIAGS